MPAPATLSADRYRLIDRLGSGGMATVWLAHDERLARDVAIKIIADTLAGDDEWRERFAREARAAAAIKHPNVVPVFDFGFDDGRPFLVMEHVSGPTLATALKNGHDFDARRLADELLDAVAHVHSAGIVHRDIKPSNVLLDEKGAAHLTDFGIAQSPDATALTETGLVIGTAGYLAPEVLAGGAATPASDLYSAGRVIAEAAQATGTTSLEPLVERLTAADPRDREVVAKTKTAATVRRKAAPRRNTTPARGPRPLIAGTLASAAALAIVAGVLLASGNGEDQPSSAAPARDRPALPAENAPLSDHLDALDSVIDQARAR